MLILNDEHIQKLKKFINEHKAFIIAGHKEPDGDCISSSIVLGTILEKLGKPYQIINAGPFKRTETKKFEKFFKGQWILQTSKKEDTGLFIVDCSELFRLGDIEQQITGLDMFVIDHHKTASCDEEHSIIDPTSPATAAIIQQLYELIIGKPDSVTASILFFGLSTDTGYFKFLDNTSSEVFNLAARLVDSGANPRLIYDEISSGKPYLTRKLLGTTLDKAEQYFNGKLVIAVEKMEDTRKYGVDGRDSDALYQLLLAVENVEAVVFVREETEKTCTIGLRSRNDVDVSSIAAVFGGGGHKNAAGVCTEGNPDTIIPRLKQEFAKFF